MLGLPARGIRSGLSETLAMRLPFAVTAGPIQTTEQRRR